MKTVNKPHYLRYSVIFYEENNGQAQIFINKIIIF